MVSRAKLIILSFALACMVNSVQAKHLYIEQEYQQKWCSANNGQMEVVMSDGSRADCITDKYAIEFDFAPKFQEAIGQSEEYAVQTGKLPGIVLILENPSDQHYLNRLMPVADKLGIKVWTMKPEDLRE